MSNPSIRIQIYAFLAHVFSVSPNPQMIHELKQNSALLSEIGKETLEWFNTTPEEQMENLLKADYALLFETSNPPVESNVIDSTAPIKDGLQNPVMMFYTQSGFEFKSSETTIKVPDHISIELAFMQNLITKDETALQEKFLKHHLAFWAPPYVLSIKEMAKTPFYRDLCDFTAEFLISEYCHVGNQLRG